MPQKKILLIIALMFACIAWFIFDSDKNETSIAVHGLSLIHISEPTRP